MTGACILWTKRINPRTGYGQQTVDGRTWRAHRVAWIQKHGPIPPGLCVLHECDVRACVNVDHLFLGTQAENLADMRKKNRHFPPPIHNGEHNNNAKFSSADVLTIREIGRSIPTKITAARFGVSKETINNILSGRTRAQG